MFAKRPESLENLFYWTKQNFEDVRSIYANPRRLLDGLQQTRRFLAPEINIQYDPCNFSVDYKFPVSDGLETDLGTAVWKYAKLPRLRFEHRNPYCQLPPPQPQPQGTGFYVGNQCNCGIRVTFAFEKKAELPPNGGAGIALCLFTNTASCPAGLTVLGQFSVNKLSGYFEQGSPLNDSVGILLTQAFRIVGGVGADSTQVFTSVIEYDLEDVVNGYIQQDFPRYAIDGQFIDAPWEIIRIDCVGCEPNPPGIEPPPPPKPKEPCCMCCEGQQNNDALLRLVLKRIGNLPANVPDNFTKQNPSFINIESLAELMLWQMQQLDALMGAYPIEIEIEDNDLTKEGNQKEKITVPNQAEAMAELLGMALTIKRDTHATLITALKAMGEAGMTKNLAVQTLDVALSNAEFLGYKLNQKKKKIPSLFTPNGKDITETLQEKEIEIVSYENDDTNDLQDDLKILKTMAARWNAQNWRAVRGDVVESLKQTLFGNPDAIANEGKKQEQPDFNDFTEQAERGFIEVTGISDSINPWGRPYAERPKIREIGQDGGRYDNEGKLIKPET